MQQDWQYAEAQGGELIFRDRSARRLKYPVVTAEELAKTPPDAIIQPVVPQAVLREGLEQAGLTAPAL